LRIERSPSGSCFSLKTPRLHKQGRIIVDVDYRIFSDFFKAVEVESEVMPGAGIVLPVRSVRKVGSEHPGAIVRAYMAVLETRSVCRSG